VRKCSHLPAKLLAVQLDCRARGTNAGRRGVADLGHQAVRAAAHNKDALVGSRIVDGGADDSRNVSAAVVDRDGVDVGGGAVLLQRRSREWAIRLKARLLRIRDGASNNLGGLPRGAVLDVKLFSIRGDRTRFLRRDGCRAGAVLGGDVTIGRAYRPSDIEENIR